ncbi:MAG TPA: arginase family protein [Thermomicrobiaceae bacterium]|nr:arginase family protein [Thermomicrobiaceae bacterium]
MDLHVVEIQYRNADRSEDRVSQTAAFREARVYASAGGELSFATPELADSERTADEIENLGLMGGHIADAVADGLHSMRPVVVTGGNCSHVPGVVGGIQQALGPDARIGLVWFDAHGDSNTPKTTLSGMLGGMPVSVSMGLCYPTWRELSHQPAPLPTDRIIMWDVRNLDPKEEALIRATAIEVAGRDDSLDRAIDALAEKTDFIYLHIDLDILDAELVPAHGTKEPNGPGMAETLEAVEKVLATGKVGVVALVSVYTGGEGGPKTLESGKELMRGSIERWQRHQPQLAAWS